MYTHQGNTLTMTTFVKKVKVFSMSFGHEHFLVLINHGIMSCGSGSRGQLGHGNNENCTKPKFIDFFGGLNITSFSAGGWHSAAITFHQLYQTFLFRFGEQIEPSTLKIMKSSIAEGGEDKYCFTNQFKKTPSTLPNDNQRAGVLYLWGWNNFGQLALENKSLGNNHVSISNFPEAVETNDTDWISVKCGSSCTFALNENGKIYSWGFNKYLQLLRQTNLDLFSYIPTELTISNPKKMDSKNEPKILKSSVETRILNYTSNCWISCLLIQDVCVNCTD
ncbi:hypothetical protein A3Q56_01685 [Intoshia linei]|uniref:Uncharacterized protein n=1 Tax=Intoshia linei TaxID=1819745 RepID=A0A177B8G2_9BILA|nr:hypothetical protein A3Q56_01685 [Intoshia linei]